MRIYKTLEIYCDKYGTFSFLNKIIFQRRCFLA